MLIKKDGIKKKILINIILLIFKITGDFRVGPPDIGIFVESIGKYL